MQLVSTKPVDDREVAAFLDILGPERTERLHTRAEALRKHLAGGTLWHVNSTAGGGGVAEMLHTLVPLYRYLGVDVRWCVIDGDDRFFSVTKRLGNLVYGSDDPGDGLDGTDRRCYVEQSAAEAAELLALAGRDDVILLHDHQTAGLAARLVERTASILWRCHVGVDAPTQGSRTAWAFLGPQLERADRVAFSVSAHVPGELAGMPVTIVPPIIWPLSAKNRTLPEPVRRDHLRRCGLYGLSDDGGGVTVLGGTVRDPDAPLAVQVSRWDRLKDMHGVLDSFARHVPDAHLALVGPDPGGVPDDPDQQHWFDICADMWRTRPDDVRRRISVVCLPMDDLDENARTVNAVQQSADVVVQKSLAEGFGLTVTEAMWKARPVIGSAVGGIVGQIRHGENGFLLQDPHDHAQLGALVRHALRTADRHEIGARAHHDVHRDFLPDRDVDATAEMIGG